MGRKARRKTAHAETAEMVQAREALERAESARSVVKAHGDLLSDAADRLAEVVRGLKSGQGKPLPRQRRGW